MHGFVASETPSGSSRAIFLWRPRGDDIIGFIRAAERRCLRISMCRVSRGRPARSRRGIQIAPFRDIITARLPRESNARPRIVPAGPAGPAPVLTALRGRAVFVVHQP